MTSGNDRSWTPQPYCDKPDDCPNGPDWHEFIPPTDLRICPCARQDWEEETP